MRTAYVLTGIIASGKSTWAKENVDSNTFIVCKDDIRCMIYGHYEFVDGDESLVDKVAKDIVARLLDEGANVIIDFGWDTLKRGGRVRLFQWLKEVGATMVYQKFFAAIEGAVERRLQNNHGNIKRKTWEVLVQSMIMDLEIPEREDKLEHFHEWIDITKKDEGEKDAE
jgi:predicted kinase